MPVQTTYTYSLANDFPGGQINSEKLEIAIKNSGIVTALVGINTNGDVVQIVFADVLSTGDKTTLDGNTSHPAGGLIASTDTSPFLSIGGDTLLASMINANMNSTADQAIYFQSNDYIIRRITVLGASAALLLATGGIYTGKGKTGNIIVPATQLWTGLTSPGSFLDLTLQGVLLNKIQNEQIMYLSLTTPEGSPKTVDLLIYGEDYSQ
jgi:hypothetical protein